MTKWLLDKSSVLLALKRFFNGELFNPEGISLLRCSLRNLAHWHQDQAFSLGLGFIERPVSGDEEYDFTRLFIGPGRLPAPPYGSAYCSTERLLMQEETLAVRRYYQRYGLASKMEGSQPDDFLPVELEFLVYLLTMAGRHLELGGKAWKTTLNAYGRFHQRHLLPWIEPFAKDIALHASTNLLKGIGMVLAATLPLEVSEWADCDAGP